MKKIFFIASMLLLSACSEKVYERVDVKVIHGIYYEVDSDKPVNGRIIEKYDDGQIEKETIIVDGYIQIVRQWRQSGQLLAEKKLTIRKGDGQEISWYESGEQMQLINYENGKRDGVTQNWYRSGQLESEVTFRNGEINGLNRSWSEEGNLTDEVNWVNGQKNGLAISYCYANIYCKFRESVELVITEDKDDVYKTTYCFRNDDLVEISNCSE